MFLTEREILDTPNALERTISYWEASRDKIKAFFQKYTQRKFVILGCGSSYMLAKSAAALFQSFPDTTAYAIPAGDYLVDYTYWSEVVRGSILISLSRSGRTSEMVWAIRHAKENFSCPVISVSMEDKNDIMPMGDLNLTLNWCYDESVCQTRTVTNLYTTALLLAGEYAGDEALIQSVRAACKQNRVFQQANRTVLEQIASMDWNNAVVLADGPVCGIAEEASLAFTEIAMLPGRYFHLLDYRHGPIVISGKKTLTLMLLRPGEDKYQMAMVHDVMSHGGPVITVSEDFDNPYHATAHIQISGINKFAAWGIPFIYVAQIVALRKAVNLGGNPDAPNGLDAYITLT